MAVAEAPMCRGCHFAWWIPVGAILICGLYAPTLQTRFDFADDGILVYPDSKLSVAGQFEQVWQHSRTEFFDRGPFRPMTWAHWDLAAYLLGPNDVARRLERFAWSILAAASLMWFLYELRLHPQAILLAAALSMWNPYRGEIWIGLGLTEAFAMPYALVALAAALRAARSPRAIGWDALAIVCLVAALAVKNTFAALIPAIVYMRLVGGGLSLRDGLRKHFWTAGVYALTLIYPVTHFILFKLNPSVSSYSTGFDPNQLPRFLKSLTGGMSRDVMAPGLIAIFAAIVIARRRGVDLQMAQYRTAIVAGLLLLAAGTAVYLPINGVAGRYTIPAIWGADVLVAVLLSILFRAPVRFWSKLASALFIIGLAVVAVMSVGKQVQVKARNELFWQALEHVETNLPRGAEIGWLGTDVVGVKTKELPFSEGFHFQGHLVGRQQSDIKIKPLLRNNPPASADWPPWVMTGTDVPPSTGEWVLIRRFESRYWAERRTYECFLWTRAAKPRRKFWGPVA